MRRWVIGAAIVTSLFFGGSHAWACDSVGPNGHVGKTLSVSPSAIEIRDFQTGNSLTFQATTDQLSGVRPGDRVMITFKEEGKVLVAEKIRKLR
ncbi:MAG: hypothetical protein ACE5K9_01970 [Candidatus Methylomirabilales bacterium]